MVAISSTFSHAGDRAIAPDAIVDVALRAQATGIVLDAGMPRDLLEPLQIELERRRDELPIVALEAPCPAVARAGGREAELCAPDRDEARAALEAAGATVRRAGAVGARFVVVRLGEVRPVAADWTRARDRFLRGELDGAIARRMVAARDASAERARDAARRALEPLAREAERAGVTLALRNGRRYVDVPSPRELDLLRAELRGAPVAPMLDVAAAHLTDVMGFQPLALTLAAWGEAPLCYFGDACGPVGALAPGRGVVDLQAAARGIGAACEIAFSPWGGLSLDEVQEAPSLVARFVRGARG